MKFIYKENEIIIKDNNEIIAQIKFKKINNDTYDIYKTYVNPAYRGKKIAQMLVKEAYNYLKDKGYNIIATCSYANKWLQTNEKSV